MGSEKDDGHTRSLSSADGDGLSLWLVPPEDSEIHHVLTDAIARMVPSVLAAKHEAPLPRFEPHVTLAVQIPRVNITAFAANPQAWLDNIDLPDNTSPVDVEFQELAVGDAFHKKLFIRCRQTDSLLSLASACQTYSGVEMPGGPGTYDPHISLV